MFLSTDDQLVNLQYPQYPECVPDHFQNDTTSYLIHNNRSYGFSVFELQAGTGLTDRQETDCKR